MTAAGASVKARDAVLIEPALRQAQPPTSTFSGPEPAEGPRRQPIVDEIHLIAHGSPDPRHGASVLAIAERLRHAAVTVTVSFLEHNRPSTSEALSPPHPHAARPAPRTSVVIPLLLTAGVHWHRDIPAVVGQVGQRRVLLAPPQPAHFAPAVAAVAGRSDGHPRGPTPEDGRRRVVLASAGSTHPGTADRLATLAARVAKVTGRNVAEVVVAQRPDDVLTSAGPDDMVVPLLIAEGIFADRIRAAAAQVGADVTAVLGETSSFAAGLRELVAQAVRRPAS